MHHGGHELTAELVAAGIAPIIDRLRLSIARKMPDRAQTVAAEFGIGGPALGTIAMLRNTLPDRVIDADHLYEVFVYTPRGQVADAVGAPVKAGLVDEVSGDSYRLSGRGGDLVREVYGLSMQLVDDQWSAHSDLLPSLAELAQRAVTAARSTGGKAFDVLAPPWEPDHASPAMLLAERLTPLRFHRFDAHIAAWRAAGLTVDEAQSLPAGPLRDSIERDTNHRAAAPYATLSVEERFTFCAGLGALPG